MELLTTGSRQQYALFDKLEGVLLFSDAEDVFACSIFGTNPFRVAVSDRDSQRELRTFDGSESEIVAAFRTWLSSSCEVEGCGRKGRRTTLLEYQLRPVPNIDLSRMPGEIGNFDPPTELLLCDRHERARLTTSVDASGRIGAILPF